MGQLYIFRLDSGLGSPKCLITDPYRPIGGFFFSQSLRPATAIGKKRLFIARTVVLYGLLKVGSANITFHWNSQQFYE
jgi:hypothetical protein